jgi:hypothetical protein
LRMPSSRMLRRVALVRTDVSKECMAFLRSVCRLLVTANVVPSSLALVTLMMEAVRSSETSVLTRLTRRNIPEDTILQCDTSFLQQSDLVALPTRHSRVDFRRPTVKWVSLQRPEPTSDVSLQNHVRLLQPAHKCGSSKIRICDAYFETDYM